MFAFWSGKKRAEDEEKDAFELIKKAVEADEKLKFEEAIALYTAGIEKLLKKLKGGLEFSSAIRSNL